MNIVERVKNIIIKPKDEWNVISQETTTVTQLTTGYLLILALIPAIAMFIGLGLFSGAISYGFRMAIIMYITYVGGAFLSAFIIDALAPSFGSQKNFTKAFLLVVYSLTPMFVACIFYIIPVLGFLSIVGLYGFYLLYLGLKPMMQTPDDKVTGYFIVSLLVTIAVSGIIFAILRPILLPSIFRAAAIGYPGM